MRLYFIILTLFLCLGSNCKAQDAWQLLNGPQFGEVRIETIDSSGRIYATVSPSSGTAIRPVMLYRSTDDGITWTFASDINVVDLEVDHTGTLVTLVQNAEPPYQQILRSTDQGITWSRLLDINAESIALKGDLIFLGRDGIVARYGLDGDQWRDFTLVPGSNINDYEYKVFWMYVTPGGSLLAGGRDSAYRSTDNGENWHRVTSAVSLTDVRYLYESPEGILYAYAYSSGVWRSTDDGESWTGVLLGDGPTFTNRPAQFAMLGNGEAFAIKARNKDTLYSSTDRGESWSKVAAIPYQSQFTGPQPKWMAATPSGSLLLASPFVGLMRSTDMGISWRESTTGMTGSYVGTIAVAPEGMIYAGFTKSAAKSSSDGGATWETLPTWDAKVWPRQIAALGGILIVAADGGVFRSTNGGKQWKRAGSPFDQQYEDIRSLAVMHNGAVLVGGYRGLFVSNDSSMKWKEIGLGASTDTVITAIGTLPDQTIVAGTRSGLILLSRDGGLTWTESKPDSVVDEIIAMTVTPDNVIYCATNPPGVGRSDDAGKSWVWRSVDGRLESMAAVFVAPDADVYIGGKNSSGPTCYRSVDGGITWEGMSSGLRGAAVLSFAVDSAGYILAGTEYKGIARSTARSVAGITVSPIRNSQVIGRMDNYPNPVVNGSTTFTFFIEGSERTRLEIYDLLGRRVAVVLDRELQDGMHSIEWNDIRLDPGVYQCMLRAGRQVIAGRMVIQ